MNKKLLLFVVVLLSTTTLVYNHGWYGRGYDTHRYCRGYNDHRGFSKYGSIRKGGVLDGKPFYYYGTQRIWWNDTIPYVRYEQQWLPWAEVYPTLDAPKKKTMIKQ